MRVTMEPDTQKQVVALIDDLVQAELSIARHFRFHADVCGCGNISECGSLDAREYRGKLFLAESARDNLYSMLGIP